MTRGDRVRHHDVDVGGGVSLHVTEVGPAGSPAVLVLHGVGSSSRFVREAFAGPVNDAGRRLLAADLRGHGASTPLPDPSAHGFDRHLGDVAALAARFSPEVLGGISLGAHAAVGAAAAGVPCRAVLACLPAWSGRAVPGEGPHAAVATEVADVGAGGMVARFRADTTMVPWLREVLVRDWPTHDPASLAAALTALDGAQAPTSTELADLPVPLALVGWPDDPGHPLAVARDWERIAPRAHLEVTSLDAIQGDRTALGRAALTALRRVGGSAGEGVGGVVGALGQDGLGGA